MHQHGSRVLGPYLDTFETTFDTFSNTVIRRLNAIITWFGVHCCSNVLCTQRIVQYNALLRAIICDYPTVLSNAQNRYFFVRNNKIRQILMI